MEHNSKPEKVYAIRPNKSQLKREHDKIKKFVITLIEKTPQSLKRLSISEKILEQIYIAQNIKGSAYQRQIKHIANQLIKLGDDTLQSLQNNNTQKITAVPKKTYFIDTMIVELIEDNENFLEQTLEKYPQLDRQKLRNLLLSIRREKQKNIFLKTTKTLRKYLHQQIHQNF